MKRPVPAASRSRLIPAVLFFLLVFMAGPAPAADPISRAKALDETGIPWEIAARRMDYREKEGVYLAEGEVVITKGAFILSSQKATYYEKTGIVEVSGNVHLDAAGDILDAEHAVFNLNTFTGQITRGRLFLRENHYYISGDHMERTGPNTYLVQNCRLTTCDGETADWSITGSEVNVTIEGYATVKNTVFRIRETPAFYLPYAIFPVKTIRQTGVLPPRLGYSSRNGVDLEIPFFWAISDQTDATFYERYMDKRGLMQGLEYRYIAEGNSKGNFLFDILSDSKEKKDLNDPKEVELSPWPRTNKTRYWLRGKADQQLPMEVKARLDADFVSDQDYLREFQGGLYGFQGRPDLSEGFGRSVEEIRSPWRRSALRLSRDRQDYSLQAQTSYFQRPESPDPDDIPQPLGAFDFALLPRALFGSRLLFKMESDYDYLWRERGQRGERFSLSPALSYPLRFSPYVELEPSIRYTTNMQRLDRRGLMAGRRFTEAYDFETRLSTILERTFDVAWGNADRLKHKFSPSLIYSFRAPRDEGRYRPWFDPIDEQGKIHRLTLALDNLLDARQQSEKEGVSYSQWASFSLYQGYDISERREEKAPGERRRLLLPLTGIISLNPSRAVTLDLEASWDHYDHQVSFADVALEYAMERSGGRRDYYSIDYVYVKGITRSLNLGLQVNLLYGFSVGTYLKKELEGLGSEEKTYWLDYQSQCWGVRVIGESADGGNSVMVAVRLLGLGDLRSR